MGDLSNAGLSLRRIHKRFGAVVVADGIDLDVPRRQTLGVLGPNGAGKSTLFSIITGTLRPDSGTIGFAGGDLSHLSPEARCRRGVARSFQIPQPFGGMTVFENLMVAARFGGGLSERAAIPRCLDVLERCGLSGQGNAVAGGLRLLDRKRLELARALASGPRLLLLDEVAGGLTEPECQELVILIGTVRAAGVTIVWVEHVVQALLAVVDRLVVLHGGRFIADGLPRTVIADAKVREVYMGIDAGG